MEFGYPAGVAQSDCAGRGLLRQSQHPPALVGDEQPGLHTVRPASPDCTGTQPDTILATNVSNPFYSMFSAGCSTPPCFNEPNSNYGALSQTIPLGNLLNKYPQFSGDFEGLALEKASSWYHAMQIRFQKRTTHNISFEGSYTISKSTDTSSAGRTIGWEPWVPASRNNWIA